jgi:hypothetical protein
MENIHLEQDKMTFFIYFSFIGEVVVAVFATIMFFLPGSIAKWSSIFFYISELPALSSSQIVIIISDAGGVTYATFGIPRLWETIWPYMFLALTFIAVQNMFDFTERDYFGRAPRGSGRRFSKR